MPAPMGAGIALFLPFFPARIPWRWYNFPVPTPFYHLSVAADLLKSAGRAPGLPEEQARSVLSESVRRLLEGQTCIFLLGNTAPDVQVVSGQPRQATHFFGLPIDESAPPPWELILRTYPSLARPERLPADHATFLAGYLCHLLADWLWIKDIYAPVFGPDCAWGTFPQRLVLHNVLRAYLDRGVLESLPAGSGFCLDGVSPKGWLPFVDDRRLVEWRDYLSRQLHPGAAAETVEVFARRAGVSPGEFHSLLDSPERMQVEVFARMPLPRLVAYRRQVLAESARLLNEYLSRSGARLAPGRRPSHVARPGL